MVGRAIGAVLLSRVSAAGMLALFTAINLGLCLFVAVVGGPASGFVALSIGFFNSIMFPLIFTLTLERSSASEEATSGLLCLAIVGGAFVPLLTARVSDLTAYHTSLLVPAVCYLALCLFAVQAGRTAPRRHEEDLAVATIH
jgi:FHS family L-fucose permease-like MFS transporter